MKVSRPESDFDSFCSSIMSITRLCSSSIALSEAQAFWKEDSAFWSKESLPDLTRRPNSLSKLDKITATKRLTMPVCVSTAEGCLGQPYRPRVRGRPRCALARRGGSKRAVQNALRTRTLSCNAFRVALSWAAGVLQLYAKP